MTYDLGPILYARGQHADRLHYALLLCGTQIPEIELPDPAAQLKQLTQHGSLNFWTAEFSLPVGTSQAQYRVNGQSYQFFVPQPHEHIRLAFSSCNGSERDEPGSLAMPAQNALWQHLHQIHLAQPFHVQLQGGDQIYADSVWRCVPELAQWKQLPRREQYSAPYTEAMASHVRAHYFETYLTHWSRPELKQVLATIPQLMMWDDHDIFDGWGSWNERYQNSPVYRGIFASAREAYNLFQRGQVAALDTPASWAVRYGDLGILAPDLRTHRTRNEVLGPQGWQWLRENLQALQGCRELVVVSSVPLATAHFSALDPILTGLPSPLMRHIPHRWNPKQFADDIHDQWRVPAHRQEWRELLNVLLNFAETNSARITALSGEIHLGARSTITRGAQHLTQYIASGIAHPPAHPLVTWACEWLSRGTQDLPGGIDVRMERFFSPNSSRRYLAQRNWLELSLPPRGDALACWHAENHPPVRHSQPALK